MNKKYGSGVSSAPQFDRKIYPWLDRNGAPLCDDKLKIVSRSWTRKLWERYLTTLEKNQGEYLSPQSGEIQYATRRHVALWVYENSSHFVGATKDPLSEEMSGALYRAIQSLTIREWQVIQAIFYDGLNQSQTAIRLNVTKERIYYLHKHSLAKIRNWLKANASEVCLRAGFTFTQGRGG